MVGLRLLLVPMRAVLGCSWGLGGRSLAPLGASVGGPGPLSEPVWAVLGYLGASVGSLMPLLGPMWALLGCLGVPVGGLGKGSGRKVAQTRAGERSWEGIWDLCGRS